mmetsp:Transcript_29279/g.53705  ORF Transcript_29279/g.53705 Transcript_29279/m.53705 type:complete len:92 (+) Transcript_29279:2218-2493(+)
MERKRRRERMPASTTVDYDDDRTTVIDRPSPSSPDDGARAIAMKSVILRNDASNFSGRGVIGGRAYYNHDTEHGGGTILRSYCTETARCIL